MIENIFWTKRNMSREILVMIAASVGIALVRYEWLKAYIVTIPPYPYDFFELMLRVVSPVYGMTCCAGFVIVGYLLLWASNRSKSWVPGGVLFLGIFLAFLVPLPPRPLTPQEIDFAAHRADYEGAIQLARENQFKSNPNVRCQSDYTPPQYSASYTCIEVPTNNRFGPAVLFFFYGIDENFYVLYDENSARLCGSGRFDTRLDEHWYLCPYSSS